MNAQIDSFQTWLDLGCATSPESRMAVFLVRVVQKSTWGYKTAGRLNKTGRFVLAKRSLSQNGPFS